MQSNFNNTNITTNEYDSQSLDTKILINFDNKEITLDEMKNEITNLYKSFDDDRSENYQKFFNFCNKVKNGIILWKWRDPYSEMFAGFYSDAMSFFGTITRLKTKVGYTLESYEGSRLPKNGSYRELAADCNFQIYYLPESEMELIKKIYNDLLQYYEYEDLMEKSNQTMTRILEYRHIDMEDEQLDGCIDDYFCNNIDSYQHMIIN